MLKRVIETDKTGRKEAYLAFPTDHPSEGIPSMPPDIDDMDWNAIKLQVHNLLVEHQILTWSDWQAFANSHLFTNPLRRALVNLYKGER